MGSDSIDIHEYKRLQRIFHEKEDSMIARYREKAWLRAREVACMLKEKYGALKVWLYGSLARGDFTLHSDIDLLVLGFKGPYWKMYLEAEAIASPIPVSIVCVEDAYPSLLHVVKKEGVRL